MTKITKGEIFIARVTAVLASEEDPLQAGFVNVQLPTGETGVIAIDEMDYHRDISRRHMSKRFMGRYIVAKVKNLDPLELSRKEAVAEKLALMTVDVGQEFEGVVTWISKKYAEIECEHCLSVILPIAEYGMVHISDLRKVLIPGQTLKVEVTGINNEEKALVSHKKYVNNPWPTLQKKYKVYGQYLGRVVNKIQAGVFVNLEPGLDVLATFPPYMNVITGDEVAMEITDINPQLGKMKGIITALVSSVERREQGIV